MKKKILRGIAVAAFSIVFCTMLWGQSDYEAYDDEIPETLVNEEELPEIEPMDIAEPELNSSEAVVPTTNSLDVEDSTPDDSAAGAATSGEEAPSAAPASSTRTDKFIPISLVTFKSGLTYNMGQDTAAYPAKRTLNAFSINKYETCYNLWYETRIKAEKIGYYFQNPGQGGTNGKRGAAPEEDNKYQPVTMISWYDAIVWCNALSELRGRTPCYKYNGKILRDSSDTATCDLCTCNWAADGYRLPSEAEWEYAARRMKGGFQKGNLVSGQTQAENIEDSLLYAWTSENAGATQVIGTAGVPFDPNSISEPATGNANGAGLFDMSGNVLEYCWDWFEDYSADSLYGPSVGYDRVSRGGSVSDYTPFYYAGDRYSYDPNECYNYFGFRLACTVK